MMKVKEEVRRALFSHKVRETMSEVGEDRWDKKRSGCSFPVKTNHMYHWHVVIVF